MAPSRITNTYVDHFSMLISLLGSKAMAFIGNLPEAVTGCTPAIGSYN